MFSLLQVRPVRRPWRSCWRSASKQNRGTSRTPAPSGTTMRHTPAPSGLNSLRQSASPPSLARWPGGPRRARRTSMRPTAAQRPRFARSRTRSNQWRRRTAVSGRAAVGSGSSHRWRADDGGITTTTVSTTTMVGNRHVTIWPRQGWAKYKFCMTRGTWYDTRGTWHLVRDTWHLALGTSYIYICIHLLIPSINGFRDKKKLNLIICEKKSLFQLSVSDSNVSGYFLQCPRMWPLTSPHLSVQYIYTVMHELLCRYTLYSRVPPTHHAIYCTTKLLKHEWSL